MKGIKREEEPNMQTREEWHLSTWASTAWRIRTRSGRQEQHTDRIVPTGDTGMVRETGMKRAMGIMPEKASILVIMIMSAATRARRINPIRNIRTIAITAGTKAMARARITRNRP